jgi:hypothetical protein
MRFLVGRGENGTQSEGAATGERIYLTVASLDLDLLCGQQLSNSIARALETLSIKNSWVGPLLPAVSHPPGSSVSLYQKSNLLKGRPTRYTYSPSPVRLKRIPTGLHNQTPSRHSCPLPLPHSPRFLCLLSQANSRLCLSACLLQLIAPTPTTSRVHVLFMARKPASRSTAATTTTLPMNTVISSNPTHSSIAAYSPSTTMTVAGGPASTEPSSPGYSAPCVPSSSCILFHLLKPEPVSRRPLPHVNAPNQGARIMGASRARFLDATPWQIICLQCAAINGVIFLNDCYRLAVVTCLMERLVPSG